IDLGSKSDSAPKPLLKCWQCGLEPARLPKVGLLLKMNDARPRDLPPGERGLTMVGGVGFGALGQFHKFSSENIVQPQLSGDFLSNVETMGSPCNNVPCRHFQITAVASCGNTLCWANIRSTGSSISAQGKPSVFV